MEQDGVDNEVNFLDLLVAIETSNKHLSLLLAVCDRDRLRSSLTERYEQELATEGIKSYRVTIDRQEPSLFAAINQLVEAEPYLQAGNPAVITVEGVVSLSSFALEGERSPVDKFLGYLQWTREGMRQFEFPIVIWVTEHIHNEISRKAQDFYSWRQGVFFFEAIQEELIVPIDVEPIDLPEPETDDLDLPIDELLVYIAQREAAGQEDASLATFYTLLARAYEQDNQIDQAISIWQKAINLQEKLNLYLDQASSLNSLGLLYISQGKYALAELILQNGLELRQELLENLHPDIATSFNNLALLYNSQGKYEEAEDLYLHSLAIRQSIIRHNLRDKFSTFLIFDGLGSLKWIRDPKLRRSIDTLLESENFLDAKVESIALYFVGTLQSKDSKVSQFSRWHLISYAQETCYLTCLKLCIRFKKDELLEDCFQLANAMICRDTFFANYNSSKGISFSSYVSLTVENKILEFVATNPRSDWGLLAFTSSKQLKENLALISFLPNREGRDYIYIHKLYKEVCKPLGAGQKRVEPSNDQLQIICDHFNQSLRNTNTIKSVEALYMLKQCIKAIREQQQNFVSPKSLHAITIGGEDSKSLLDTIESDVQYFREE